MRLLLALAVCAGCVHRSVIPGASVGARSEALQRDIAFLSSDALEGRATGTPGNDTAAAYVARRFAALGLVPLGPGYLQRFDARPAAAAHAAQPVVLPSANVVALLPGRDPALRGEAVGTAAVMEIARLLAASPPRRSVIFAAFTGEELGLLGSQYFVEHSPFPLDSVVAMLNFDMVGRLRNDKLIVYGTATAAELGALLDSANVVTSGPATAWPTPLHITALGDGFGPSDHSSFYAHDRPVLHFFTDLHPDYHRATDDADSINAVGEAHVVDVAVAVTRLIADRPGRLTFVRSAAPARTMSGSREGSNVYLGSIPDMTAGDIAGLRLTGVPGDEVVIVVVRRGERRSFPVTLGTRGG